MVGIGRKPQNSAAAAVGRFELEDRFNRFGPRARHVAGCSPMRSRLETGRLGSADMPLQLSRNSVQAVDGSDVPSEGQHIPPMAVSMKQCLKQNVVWFRESPFKLRKPSVCGRRD